MKTRDVECTALSPLAKGNFTYDKGPRTAFLREADEREFARQHEPFFLPTLCANAVTPLSLASLTDIYQHATAAAIQRFYQPLAIAMTAAEIVTPLREAHFLAQLGHESGELRYTEELASGAAYEGRADLGNTQPGDGIRFKGRGLIQLTGRANYTAFGQSMGRDLCEGDHPKLVASDPALCVGAATWFWTKHNLNALADCDDLRSITRAVNGGLNGLPDRQRLLDRAKQSLCEKTRRSPKAIAQAIIKPVRRSAPPAQGSAGAAESWPSG